MRAGAELQHRVRQDRARAGARLGHITGRGQGHRRALVLRPARGARGAAPRSACRVISTLARSEMRSFQSRIGSARTSPRLSPVWVHRCMSCGPAPQLLAPALRRAGARQGARKGNLAEGRARARPGARVAADAAAAGALGGLRVHHPGPPAAAARRARRRLRRGHGAALVCPPPPAQPSSGLLSLIRGLLRPILVARRNRWCQGRAGPWCPA